jgi:hypothetical protein
MITKRILVLANSTKHYPKSCVAGRELIDEGGDTPNRAVVIHDAVTGGLLLAAAFIAVLFFVPAILLIYMGEAWGGVTGWMLMIVLLLAFLVPQFDTLLQPKLWVFPGATLALAFVVLGVGLIAAGRYDQAHPWLDNLRYEYDANTGQAVWVSEATRRDEWLAQIFPTDRLRAEAPVVDLPLPELETLDDQVENGLRTLHLRLAADPGVVRYRFSVQAGSAQPALTVNGKPVRLGVSPDGDWRTIDLYAPPADGYELALQYPVESPITIRLENSMLGLPAGLDLPPRPENIASFGDSTTVRLDTILNP